MEVFDAVEPLNRRLCGMHGPTPNIAETMSRLVRFPEDIGSLPDAEVLDLNVLVSADLYGTGPDSAFVEASLRYATSWRMPQVLDFYDGEFAAANTTQVWRHDPNGIDERGAERAVLLADGRTRYDIAVTAGKGYRSVKVTAQYQGFDPSEIFARFAGWHNGSAPVHAEPPTSVEISTFAAGRRPGRLVLYSTGYESPTTPWSIRRAMVEERIGELGWTYREPREGIMFIQDLTFDAETHVDGDDLRSSVTFVGEFPLL